MTGLDPRNVLKIVAATGNVGRQTGKTVLDCLMKNRKNTVLRIIDADILMKYMNTGYAC